MMALPWHTQELQVPITKVLNEIRADILDGHFDWKTWDHKAPNYVKGRSNKQAKITAHLLVGSEDEIDFETCKKILIRAALGYPVHYDPTTRTVRTSPKG